MNSWDVGWWFVSNTESPIPVYYMSARLMRVTPKSHGVRISIGFGLMKMMTLFSGFKAWRISVLKIKPHIWSLQVPFCGSGFPSDHGVELVPLVRNGRTTATGFRAANTDLISARAVGHQRASSAWCSRPDVSDRFGAASSLKTGG